MGIYFYKGYEPNSATRYGAKYHGTKDKIEDVSALNWPDKEILLRNKACDLGIWEGMTGGECLLALAVHVEIAKLMLYG